MCVCIVHFVCFILSHAYLLKYILFKKNFEQRLQKAIENTTRECEALAAAEAERVARIHKNEVDSLNQR